MNTTAKPALFGFNDKSLWIGFSMVLAAMLAVWMKPTQKLASQQENINLEAMIPRQFKNWKIDESVVQQLIAPDVQASLNRIYNDTLSRTYVNEQGQKIMLSIAYGGDQSDELSVHFPETCYHSQGFAINDKIKGILPTHFGDIPVTRLIASTENRNEPITYWIVIGDRSINDKWGMKKAKLMYTFKGQVSDGILVRISSISPNPEDAFKLQGEFADDLLESIDVIQRKRLTGVNIQ